ncbi:MAG: hypothetical protein WBC73_05125 [Phormidesmis sp.]
MTDKIIKIEQQQATNTQVIADINTAVNTLVTEFIRPLAQQSIETQRVVDENTKAINALTDIAADAEAERTEQNQRFESFLKAVAEDRKQAERDRTEQNQRFENLLNDARADRQQIQAEREENHRQFEENKRRFDAQLQISQAMLVELAKVNSRLEILERAS